MAAWTNLSVSHVFGLQRSLLSYGRPLFSGRYGMFNVRTELDGGESVQWVESIVKYERTTSCLLFGPDGGPMMERCAAQT